MSATARVSRAIKQVREIEAAQPKGVGSAWLARYKEAVAELAEEAQDALHLTNDDIAKY